MEENKETYQKIINRESLLLFIEKYLKNKCHKPLQIKALLENLLEKFEELSHLIDFLNKLILNKFIIYVRHSESNYNFLKSQVDFDSKQEEIDPTISINGSLLKLIERNKINLTKIF